MNAYNVGHAFIMWGFYALGCVIIGLLALLGLVFFLGWCSDRWHRRQRPFWPRWRWLFWNDRLELGVDLGCWMVGIFALNWCVGINLGPLDITCRFPRRAIR
jgi:hypothetical protein